MDRSYLITINKISNTLHRRVSNTLHRRVSNILYEPLSDRIDERSESIYLKVVDNTLADTIIVVLYNVSCSLSFSPSFPN